MPQLVSLLVARILAHPQLLVSLVPLIVEAIDAAPDAFIAAMPEGPAKEHAKANHDQVIKIVRMVGNVLTENPDLIRVLIQQFGRR